jgi:methylglutaconyl-CoA hydratase
MTSSVLVTTDSRGIATVMLNRPASHNALDAEIVNRLHSVLIDLEQDKQVRAVVLTGAGKSFCAGGDLLHMQRMAGAGDSVNFADALMLARCLRKLDEFAKPVLARVNGHAFGGGLGLIACADIAIASTQARFCFAEVRVGLVAATIGPYVIAAMGARTIRRLLLTAASFDAAQARAFGLLHQAVDEQELDHCVEQEITLLLQGGPQAQHASKQLVLDVAGMGAGNRDLQMTRTARELARIRASPEAREGIKAFIEKRSPQWPRT